MALRQSRKAFDSQWTAKCRVEVDLWCIAHRHKFQCPNKTMRIWREILHSCAPLCRKNVLLVISCCKAQRWGEMRWSNTPNGFYWVVVGELKNPRFLPRDWLCTDSGEISSIFWLMRCLLLPNFVNVEAVFLSLICCGFGLGLGIFALDYVAYQLQAWAFVCMWEECWYARICNRCRNPPIQALLFTMTCRWCALV